MNTISNNESLMPHKRETGRIEKILIGSVHMVGIACVVKAASEMADGVDEME